MALQGIGVYHQDVQPLNVKVSEAGEISLIDYHCLDPVNFSGYKRMVANYTLSSPISPQLIKSFVSKTFDPKYSIEKNDVWSAGITMVCAATVGGFKDFYDFTYGNINMDKINERLALMKQLGYSDYFIRCIANMLNPNEDYRPSLKDLLNFLNHPQQATAGQNAANSDQRNYHKPGNY